MKDPTIVTATLSFKQADSYLKDQNLEGFLVEMRKFSKLFNDIPELNFQSLTTFPIIKSLGKNGRQIFFKALHEFLCNFGSLVDKTQLSENLPIFVSRDDLGAKKLVNFLLELTKLEKELNILNLPNLRAFKDYQDKNICNMLTVFSKLQNEMFENFKAKPEEVSAKGLGVKSIEELPAFKALSDAEVQNLFKQLWHIAKNDNGFISLEDIQRLLEQLQGTNKVTLTNVFSNLILDKKPLDLWNYLESLKPRDLENKAQVIDDYPEIGKLFFEMSKLLQQSLSVNKATLVNTPAIAAQENPKFNAFFVDLISASAQGRGFITSDQINEMPSVKDLKANDHMNVGNFVAAVWEIINEFFDNGFKEKTKIEDLSNLEKVAKIGKVEKLLGMLQELAKNYKKVMDEKKVIDASVLPSFNIVDQYIRIFFSRIAEFLGNNFYLTNFTVLFTHEAFVNIRDEDEKIFFKDLWKVLWEKKGILSKEELEVLPSYKKLKETSKQAITQTIKLLWQTMSVEVDSRSLYNEQVFKIADVETSQLFFQDLWELTLNAQGGQINFNSLFLQSYQDLSESSKEEILKMLSTLIKRPLTLNRQSLEEDREFKKIDDKSLKDFFLDLWTLILSANSLKVSEIVKLASFTKLKGVYQTQLRLIFSNLKGEVEGEFERFETIKICNFSESNNIVDKLFNILAKLLNENFITLEIKNIHNQPTLNGIETQYKNVFMAMSKLLRKETVTLDVSALVNSSIFIALDDSPIKKILASMSGFLLKKKGSIVNSDVLFDQLIFRDIPEETRNFLKEVFYLLAEGSIDITEILLLPSFVNLDTQSQNNISYTLKILAGNPKNSMFDLKNYGTSPAVATLAHHYVDKFFLSLLEFSSSFKKTFELQEAFQQMPLTCFKPQVASFIDAITDLIQNLISINELKFEAEEIDKQVKRFRAWSFKVNPDMQFSEKQDPNAKAINIISASKILLLYLLKSVLKRGYGLPQELIEYITNECNNFSDLKKLLYVFESDELYAFEEKDKHFFGIQITKATTIAESHSYFLRLRVSLAAKNLSSEEISKILSPEESEKIFCEINRLYQLSTPNNDYSKLKLIERQIDIFYSNPNVQKLLAWSESKKQEIAELTEKQKKKKQEINQALNKFYEDVILLQKAIQDIGDRYLEKLKKEIEDLIPIEHFKSFMHVGKQLLDMNDVDIITIRCWFELAFIAASTTEERQIALDSLKETYIPITIGKKTSKPLKSSSSNEKRFSKGRKSGEIPGENIKRISDVFSTVSDKLPTVSDILSTERKIPELFKQKTYVKSKLEDKEKEIKNSGTAARIYRLGELERARFIFFKLEGQDVANLKNEFKIEKTSFMVEEQTFGEGYFKVYLKVIAQINSEKKSAKNNSDEKSDFFIEQIKNSFSEADKTSCKRILGLFLTAYKYDLRSNVEIKTSLDETCAFVYLIFQGLTWTGGYTKNFPLLPEDSDYKELAHLTKKVNEAKKSKVQSENSPNEVSQRSRAWGAQTPPRDVNYNPKEDFGTTPTSSINSKEKKDNEEKVSAPTNSSYILKKPEDREASSFTDLLSVFGKSNQRSTKSSSAATGWKKLRPNSGNFSSESNNTNRRTPFFRSVQNLEEVSGSNTKSEVSTDQAETTVDVDISSPQTKTVTNFSQGKKPSNPRPHSIQLGKKPLSKENINIADVSTTEKPETGNPEASTPKHS